MSDNYNKNATRVAGNNQIELFSMVFNCFGAKMRLKVGRSFSAAFIERLDALLWVDMAYRYEKYLADE